MLACARALSDPAALDPSSVSEVLGGTLIYVWAGLYGIGGLLIVIGGLTNRTEAEEPGLLLFLTGMLVNAIAIVAVRHFWGAMVTVSPYVAFAWIAAGRVRDLRRLRHAVSNVAHRDLAVAVGLPVLVADTSSAAVTLIVAVLGSGLVSALIAYLAQRRAAKDAKGLTDAQTAQLRAETGDVLDKRWKRYAEQLEQQLEARDERIRELEAAIEALEQREDELERENERLSRRVADLEAGKESP